MHVVGKCSKRGFHPHQDDGVLFKDVRDGDRDNHVEMIRERLVVVDLRP